MLFEGYDHARRGRTSEARKALARAAWTDRSWRGGLSPMGGSVTLRAVLAALAPQRMVDLRDRRATDPDKRARPVTG